MTVIAQGKKYELREEFNIYENKMLVLTKKNNDKGASEMIFPEQSCGYDILCDISNKRIDETGDYISRIFDEKREVLTAIVLTEDDISEMVVDFFEDVG